MALILNIETATRVCSVALSKDHKLIAESHLFQEHSHSLMLNTMIEQVMVKAQRDLSELDAIAVSKGPGSYTGLRIGVSSAKGMALALNIPILAVNTLKAMARYLSLFHPADSLRYCPMIDARRMEVYCAIFDAQTQEILQTEAKIIDQDSFQVELAQGPLLFFGDGAPKCEELLNQHENALFLHNISPNAAGIAPLAYQKYLEQDFEDLAYFEPFYLKDFVNNTRIKSKK